MRIGSGGRECIRNALAAAEAIAVRRLDQTPTGPTGLVLSYPKYEATGERLASGG